MKSASSCCAVGPQLPELQPTVAHHAGVRRSSRKVLVGEIIDDPIELALEVQSVKGDIEAIGNPAGIPGVDGAATALLVVGPMVFPGMRTGAHEQTDDVVPLLLEQKTPPPNCPPRRSWPGPPVPCYDPSTFRYIALSSSIQRQTETCDGSLCSLWIEFRLLLTCPQMFRRTRSCRSANFVSWATWSGLMNGKGQFKANARSSSIA